MLWKYLVVFLFIFINFGGCMRKGRIAEGKDAKLNENLDYALLHVTFQNQEQKCGGSLVAPQYVLTSATCVIDPVEGQASIINVTFPQAKINGLNKKIHLYIHPSYDYKTHDNDIAIIKLEKPMIPDGTTLSLATLATNETADLYVNTSLRVCGFGSVSNYPRPSKTLLCTDVNGVASENCPTINKTICTQWNDRDSNVCNGDYGGPAYLYEYAGAIITQKVVGIATHSPDVRTGAPCLDAHKVSFVSVAAYLSWIETIAV